MLEMKCVSKYFICASDTNWPMIEGVLRAELSSTLEAGSVLNATSHHLAVLRPLWLCLSEDTVFKHHLEEILKTWPLLLSTNKQLFYFRPSEQLLPVIAPESSSEQVVTSKTLHLKVFKVLQQASMPVLDISVVPCHMGIRFCPTVHYRQRILASLFYLYKAHTKEEVLFSDQSIKILFEYFRAIHFAQEIDSLHKVKCLPLFKDVSGKLNTLERKAYI